MKRGRLKVDPEKVLAWKRRTAKPLKKRSRKMAAVYVGRRAFVSAFLSANPRCQFPECGEASRDVHEVIRRSHGSALYPGQAGKRETRYLGLCRAHHDFVTTHPLEARALGLDEK